MTGHYPSELTLKAIREFDIVKTPLKELLDLLEGEWEFADVGGFNLRLTKKKAYLNLNTFGWSGNESLISAFEKVKLIGLFWDKSTRGGHYWYRFPRVVYEKGIRKE